MRNNRLMKAIHIAMAATVLGVVLAFCGCSGSNFNFATEGGAAGSNGCVAGIGGCFGGATSTFASGFCTGCLEGCVGFF